MADRALLCLLVMLQLGNAAMGQKTARTYYTAERLETMRRNLAETDWAPAERDKLIAAADRWVAMSDDALCRMVPPPWIPRAYTLHASGCPVHGEALNRIGRYSWIVDPAKPYQITCPVGGETYPSNDFAAFLASDRQDRSLLTGDFPDDGWGWTRPGVEKKFWFIGVWAHWSARRHVLGAIEDCSKAYLVTDDPKYAHVAALLLWQLAVYYPDYNYETQSRYGTEFQPTYKGRLLYHTWETWTVQVCGPAYDAVWPALATDQALAERAGLSGDALDAFIVERLLVTMANDITDGSNRIQGNYGMHQTGLLRVAAALAERTAEPTPASMVEWVLRNDNAAIYTGIGAEDALNNLLHRDGYPFESPGYNVAWIHDLTEIAEALADAGIDLFSHNRFRKLLSWPLAMACAGQFTPALGDSSNMFSSLVGWTAQGLSAGFERYGDPSFAKAMVQAGVRPSRDLFRPALDEAIAAAAAEAPPVGRTSSLLPGVGYATLQTGNDQNRTAVGLFYGYYVGHRHHDRLHFDLYSHDWSLTPDFGYPETADSFDPRRFGFFANTLSHNTVVVDERRQEARRGQLELFDPGEFAQVLETSAAAAYPGVTDLYHRTLMLVDTSPSTAYLVDIFRVRGGRQHDYLVHGTEADFASSLPLTAPRAGTLAGPEVVYGQFYDDQRLLGAAPGTVSYTGYAGSGYQFLFNVQQARLDCTATAEWRLSRDPAVAPRRRSEGIVLRAHLVGGDETVLVCDGKPQIRATWPETVKFMVRRRAGDALESVFVTVYEPFDREPHLASVKALPVSDPAGLPVALEVALAGGGRHLLVHRLAEGTPLVVGDGELTTDGRAAILAEGGPSYLLNGSSVTWAGGQLDAAAPWQATVLAVDYARGEVEVDADLPEVGAVAGGHAVIASSNHAAALPVAALAGPRRFLVGDDDLTAAKVRLLSIDGEKLTITPRHIHFHEPGMAVVNSAGEVLARLTGSAGGVLYVDRTDLTLDQFPLDPATGRRESTVRVVGPGDRVTIHRSNRR